MATCSVEWLNEAIVMDCASVTVWSELLNLIAESKRAKSGVFSLNIVIVYEREWPVRLEASDVFCTALLDCRNLP